MNQDVLQRLTEKVQCMNAYEDLWAKSPKKPRLSKQKRTKKWKWKWKAKEKMLIPGWRAYPDQCNNFENTETQREGQLWHNSESSDCDCDEEKEDDLNSANKPEKEKIKQFVFQGRFLSLTISFLHVNKTICGEHKAYSERPLMVVEALRSRLWARERRRPTSVISTSFKTREEESEDTEAE